MSTRHIARTLALQTLFEFDMKGDFSASPEEIVKIITRNQAEFGEGIKDVSFSINITNTVISRKIIIDDIIVRAAPDWPLEKIGTVDRNILRIGLSELLFGDRKEVPPKVAIDEAIELAKTFGGETSGRFINGVLGAIYKEMGEPEKNQTSKKVDLSTIPREELVGAVVISRHNGNFKVALVHDVFGYWTLTKGHIEGEGDKEKLATQKIKSEIGVDVKLTETLGEHEYIANRPEKGKVIKHVTYYLAESPHTPLILEKKGGLDDVRWFDIDDISSLKMYDDMKPIIDKAFTYLNESFNNPATTTAIKK